MSLAKAPARRDLKAWVFLVLAGAVLILPLLGRRDLWPSDEPRYAVVARGVLDAGGVADLFVLRLNGEVYPDKPPLYFWSEALFGALGGGIGPWAARLPSALAGILCLVLLYELGRRLAGRPVGWLAASILLATPHWVSLCQRAALDVMLTFWVLASVLCHVRAIEERDRGRSRAARAWHLTTFACQGFGVLTKGPVAVIVPWLGLVAGAVFKSRWGRLRGIPWLRGLAVLVGVVGLWLGPALWLTGGTFAHEVLWRQTAGRVSESFAHAKPFWYFARVFPVQLLPGSLVLLAGGVVLWRRRRSRRAGVTEDPGGAPDETPGREPEIGAQATRLLIPWIIAVLLFFSCISGKRGVYLMPIYPAVALLSAIVVRHLVRASRAGMDRAGRLVLGLALATSVTMFFAWPIQNTEHTGRPVGEMVRRAAVPGTTLVACQVHRLADVLYFAGLERIEEIGVARVTALLEKRGASLVVVAGEKVAPRLVEKTGGRLQVVEQAACDGRPYLLMRTDTDPGG